MSGQPGRSGGHNRLSPEVHRLRGTAPRGRHLAAAQSLPVSEPEPMPPALLEGLSGRGKAFVEACWQQLSNWNPATVELLRLAGTLLDELETLRGQKGERECQRLLLSTIQALRLAG